MEWKLSTVFALNDSRHEPARLLRVERRSRAVSENGGGHGAAAQTASILITGIGRQNAEKSVREFLATHSPELVLTCGFAGGLNPDLKPGDVVFELTDRRGELHEPQTEKESGTRVTHPSERSPCREKFPPPAQNR
jgi:hypothetical protein